MSKRDVAQRRLFDDLGTALLAIVLSLVVWVNATYQNDRPREDFFPESIPIEVLNVPNGLTITNTPDTSVKVRIKAFSSSWNSLTANNFRATVDLKNLAEGTSAVPIKVTCSDRTVSIISTQPETIYVQLEPLRKEAIEVTVELEDKEELPLGYAIDPPEVNPSFVVVEGPRSLVEQVTKLVAPVSLLGQRTTVERTVEPQPLDSEGKLVKGIKLNPPTVTVRFDIEKKLNYREVAVVARTRGNPARGYFVSSVEVSPATVTVVGPPNVIAEMPGIVSTRGTVDLNGATRMIAERLQLDLPEGVSVLNNGEGEPPQVLVTVGIDPVMGGTTVQLPLQIKGLGEGLTAKLSVTTVEVILTGPAVLLDDLQTDLLEAYVDLNGLGPGTHQVRTIVDVLVSRSPKLADLVVTSISPAFVEANVAALPTPTPTFTPGPGPEALAITLTAEAPTVTPTPTPTRRRAAS